MAGQGDGSQAVAGQGDGSLAVAGLEQQVQVHSDIGMCVIV